MAKKATIKSTPAAAPQEPAANGVDVKALEQKIAALEKSNAALQTENAQLLTDIEKYQADLIELNTIASAQPQTASNGLPQVVVDGVTYAFRFKVFIFKGRKYTADQAAAIEAVAKELTTLDAKGKLKYGVLKKID